LWLYNGVDVVKGIDAADVVLDGGVVWKQGVGTAVLVARLFLAGCEVY